MPLKIDGTVTLECELEQCDTLTAWRDGDSIVFGADDGRNPITVGVSFKDAKAFLRYVKRLIKDGPD